MVINRLINSWNVFKTSLSFIKRDKSLWIIPILSFLVNIAIFVIFIMLFMAGSLNYSSGGMFLTVIIFMLISYLVSTFFASAQSWMVYEVAKGKNTTLSSGMGRAIKNIRDIVLFSIVSLIISIILGAIRGNKNNQGAVQNALREGTAGVLGFITGIMKKLVLPAMIITDRSFIDAVKQLKEGIKAIPEIAVYEIGIGPIIGIAFVVSLIIPFMIIWAGFVWTGIILMVILIMIIGLISSLINQIYYTLVYLTIIEKKKIKGLSLKLK